MSDEVRPYLYHVWLEEKIPLEDLFIIGRAEGANYRLNDSQVSSKHCQFTIKDQDVYVTDLNSHNKTYINGRRLIANYPFRLSDKDLIYLGEQKFIFVWQTEEEFDMPDITETFSRKILERKTAAPVENVLITNEKVVSENDEYIKEIKQVRESLHTLQKQRDEIENQLLRENELNQNYKEIISEIRIIDQSLDKVSIQDMDAYNIAYKKVQDELQALEQKKRKLEQIKKLLDDRGERVLKGKGIKKEIKELNELELVDKREFIDENMAKELERFEEIKTKYGIKK